MATTWDARDGANPDTCLHMLSQVAITQGFRVFVVCVSCHSTLDDSYRDQFHWEYDIVHGCWKRHAVGCKCNIPEHYSEYWDPDFEQCDAASDEALAELRRILTGD